MTYQPDFFTTAIRMFSALLLVLGIILVAFYLFRKLAKRNVMPSGINFIRIIDRSYIGVKKSITLVEVSGKFLVLGVTNDRISLLTQIEDSDSLMLLNKTTTESPSSGFKSQLNRLLDKSKNSSKKMDALPQ